MLSRIPLVCGLLAGLIASSPFAASQAAKGAPAAEARAILGPYGGDIRGIDANRADPKEVYAVSYEKGQVFKSANSGKAWKSLAAFDARLYAVAVAPSDPKRVYALGEDRVYASSDKGATWAERAFPRFCFSKGEIVVDPKSADKIVVAGFMQTDPARYWITCPAVFISNNGGAAWTKIKVPSSYAGYYSFSCLAQCAKKPSTLYAAGSRFNPETSKMFGVFRSDNGGKTWKDVTPGIDARPGKLAVSPNNPDLVLMVSGDEVWRSSNGGLSWTPKALQPLSALTIDSGQPSVMYAGGTGLVFRSLDGGVQWTQFSGIGGTAQDLLVTAGNVYAATSTGLFRSVNKGQAWRASQARLCATVVEAMAVAPSAPRTLYAVVPANGLFKSVDGGASWTRMGASTICGNINGIAVHPQQPDWLFASVVG